MAMTMPKIFVPAGGTDETVIEWAREAEAAGADGVFVGDHVTFYGSGSDGLMKLAPIAAATTKLELQTCVYLLALRHPTPVALQCAMLDQLAKGRLVLGVGIGGEDPNEWWACAGTAIPQATSNAPKTRHTMTTPAAIRSRKHTPGARAPAIRGLA